MTTTVNSRRETASLIGSDKVEGTPVYGADDRKIGTVQRVMIDKISGKVAYAVISFGGSWEWAKTTTDAMGKPYVRHRSWRLPCWRHRRSAQRRSKI